MLVLEAKVSFDRPSDNPTALQNDLNAENIIRPVINFGNNLLFSGTLIVKEELAKLIRGEVYDVIFELPTVEEEEYKHIENLVRVGNVFFLQTASKVIGKGEIKQFFIK
ncbi:MULTISPECIES: hypothetical protein [Paenibacillus]|uniref:hypothetical protein n=1 Tax=Paenibacillus TaxID=44249 RepID=UPI002FE140BF